jgi:hypothetical protein
VSIKKIRGAPSGEGGRDHMGEKRANPNRISACQTSLTIVGFKRCGFAQGAFFIRWI